VDVLGLDDYHDLSRYGKSDDLIRRLRIVVELAAAKGKIAALTETGNEGVKDPRWWTEKFWSPLQKDPVASRIAWALVWRNANRKHHYGPFPGHASAEDFRVFSAREDVWLLDDLKGFLGNRNPEV